MQLLGAFHSTPPLARRSPGKYPEGDPFGKQAGSGAVQRIEAEMRQTAYTETAAPLRDGEHSDPKGLTPPPSLLSSI
jgi:hypothetical protein